MNDPRQRARTLIAQRAITLLDLWVRYWANGGSAKLFELDAYINCIQEPDPFELRVLEWALEDMVGDQRF